MLLRKDSMRQRRSAFTLMEMLVVVAIIVALAGIGGFFLLGALQGGQEDVARTQASGTLTTACTAYRLKHQQWPQSLQELTQKDALGGPYLENQDALIDPWGRPYQYDPSGPMNNGMKPDIWTTPPNDQNKKIGNWSKMAQQQQNPR
ncbi:MAG TPA: type II secretion system protein GspG [Gemmataceae bacterium]|nr:type II secretion system protein GspG [Gemmataceae bacterium]